MVIFHRFWYVYQRVIRNTFGWNAKVGLLTEHPKTFPGTFGLLEI